MSAALLAKLLVRKSLADGCGFCQNRKILRPCTFRLPLVKDHTSEVSNAGLARTGPCRAARARATLAAAAAKVRARKRKKGSRATP